MDSAALIELSSPNMEWPEPAPLLRLPTELLDEIFCLSYQREPLHLSYPNYARMPPHAHKPLCRRLYPSQRRALYSRVDLYSYRAILSFSRALKLDARGELADLVRSLSFRPLTWSASRAPRQTVGSRGGAQDRGRTTEQDESGEHHKLVTPRRFADLVSRLAKLEALHVNRLDPELLAVILLDKATPIKLTRLTSLEVDLDGGHGGDFDVPDETGGCGWLDQLGRFSGLKYIAVLKLEFCDFGELPTPLPVLAALTRLSITTGDLGGWSELDLSEVTPNVIDLSLERSYESTSFEGVLCTAPPALRRLVLAVTEPDFTFSFEGQFNELLRCFDRLEYLSLCEDTFEPDSLAESLHFLDNLRELKLDVGTLATDALLSSILEGPLRIPHLRTLVLDHVNCERGVTMDQLGGALTLPPKRTDESLFHWPFRRLRWFEPEFGPDCSDKGIRAALGAAQACGVVVTGTALEAVGWRDDYEAQRPAEALVRCDEWCEYGDARTIFGVGFVALRIFRVWRRDQRGE